MDRLDRGRGAAPENRGRTGTAARAVAIAIASVAIAIPAVAQAGSTGGVGPGGGAGSTGGAGAGGDSGSPGSGGGGETGSRTGCSDDQFGTRTLREGDCGKDVATLNWILKSKDYPAPFAKDFGEATDASVRSFQRDASLASDGVVDDETTEALVNAMPTQLATWYGPGFFGNTTACGQEFTKRTRGVAHKKLPCGSRVVVRYKGRFVRTRVIDRGPYANGAQWDLAQATARQLGFEYTDEIRVAKIAKPAK